MSTSTTSADNLEDQTWIEVSSEHFSVFSELSVEDATDLLHNLELLRAAIPALTNIQVEPAPIRTVILSVKSSAGLRQFGIPGRVLGMFAPGLRDNMIFVRDSRFSDDGATILHEYIHYLVRSGRVQAYPPWFDEGFAEYFGTATLNGDQFEVGRFPQWRLRQFRNCEWVHVSALISGAGRGECMFYPGSWAMVHYIQSLPDHAAKLTSYLRRIEAQENHIDAFREAFGLDVARFNFRLNRYVRKGKFQYISLPAEQLWSDFSVESRSVPRAEISLVLAEAALRLGEFDRALHWFDTARGDETLLAEAHAGLGDVWKYRGKFAKAQMHFDKAFELAPEDPLILLDVGEYWLARAREEQDTDRRDQHLIEARKYIGRSWKLDDTKPETYVVYGESFLLQERYEKAIDTLEAANYLLPSDLRIRFDLADAYFHTGRLDEAQALLQPVKAWSHQASGLWDRASALLEQVEAAQAAVPVAMPAEHKPAVD